MFYEEIFKELNKKQIDYLVVGGVASVLHGVVRLTADLDLMIHLDKRNISKFIDVMNGLGFKPKIPVRAEELIDQDQRKIWLEEKNMKVFSFLHPKQAISLIDVFIYEPIDYAKAKANSVKIKTGNLSIPVVSIDDLIRLKEISDRPQDSEDIKMLKRLKKYGQR